MDARVKLTRLWSILIICLTYDCLSVLYYKNDDCLKITAAVLPFYILTTTNVSELFDTDETSIVVSLLMFLVLFVLMMIILSFTPFLVLVVFFAVNFIYVLIYHNNDIDMA